MSYPPIADHGLIGDLQTAALVATDGTIDTAIDRHLNNPNGPAIQRRGGKARRG